MIDRHVLDTEQENITGLISFCALENTAAPEEPNEPQVELVTPDLRRPLEPLAGNRLTPCLFPIRSLEQRLALEISHSDTVVDFQGKKQGTGDDLIR